VAKKLLAKQPILHNIIDKPACKGKMDSEIDVTEARSADEKEIRFVLEHSRHATVFHTPEWIRLVSEEFNIPYRTLLARHKSLPVGMYTFFTTQRRSFRQIVSPLRTSDSIYGGPLTVDGVDTSVEEVTTALIREVERDFSGDSSSSPKRNVSRLEYYQVLPPPYYSIELLRKLGYKTRKSLTAIVDLHGSEEDLWHRVDSKRRNLVRKAQSNKLEIVDSCSEFVDLYYPMLLEVFGKSGKKPFPKSYYQRIVEELSTKGWVKPLLAFHEDKPVAGALFLCFGDTVYYWSGASLNEHKHLASNDLVQWELIKWARANGHKSYDLLMVEPERLPGIAHFKLGFGGQLVPIYEAIRRTPLGEIARGADFLAKKAGRRN
jgi:hypothetical protein